MANGKIKADTLEHSTAGSLDTSYVVNGSAKAWAEVNQSGTIGASSGISSVADEGTGGTTFNLSNSFSSSAYVKNATGEMRGGTSGGSGTSIRSGWAAGSFRTQVTDMADNSIDEYVWAVAHGDLA